MFPQLHRLEVGWPISGSAELRSEVRLALRNAVGLAPRWTTCFLRPVCIHRTNGHARALAGESRSKASHPRFLRRTDTVLRDSCEQSVHGYRTRPTSRQLPRY